MRTVVFEGWFVAQSENLLVAHDEITHLMDMTFDRFVLLGVDITWYVGNAYQDDDQIVCDYEGTVVVETTDDDEAFAVAYELLNMALSPYCERGALGDWEVVKVK